MIFSGTKASMSIQNSRQISGLAASTSKILFCLPTVDDKIPKLSGYGDAGEQMRAAYEDPSFKASVEEIYNQVAPLYKQLFTYVRRKLLLRYGETSVRPDGPIPAHLLGKDSIN